MQNEETALEFGLSVYAKLIGMDASAACKLLWILYPDRNAVFTDWACMTQRFPSYWYGRVIYVTKSSDGKVAKVERM